MVLYKNLEVNLGKNETHLNFSLEKINDETWHIYTLSKEDPKNI